MRFRSGHMPEDRIASRFLLALRRRATPRQIRGFNGFSFLGTGRADSPIPASRFRSPEVLIFDAKNAERPVPAVRSFVHLHRSRQLVSSLDLFCQAASRHELGRRSPRTRLSDASRAHDGGEDARRHRPRRARARVSGSRRRTHQSVSTKRRLALMRFRRAANRPCSPRKGTRCLCAALPSQTTDLVVVAVPPPGEREGIGLAAGSSSGTMRGINQERPRCRVSGTSRRSPYR
jgi:hypothetical protein